MINLIKILVIILSFSGFAKEIKNPITYESILAKNYENKELFLKDIQTLFDETPKDEIIKNNKGIIVNITKTNYANLLKNYTHYFIENYFNSKLNSTYNSYLVVLNSLPLTEGFKYFQANNPRILESNIKKGNYIKVLFNNRSLKNMIKDDDLKAFSANFTFELVEFVNFKKTKSYWTNMNIKFSYDTKTKELLITNLEFNVK